MDVGFILRRSPDRVVSPDAAFITFDRLPPDRDKRKFFPAAPNLAVEVKSPTIFCLANFFPYSKARRFSPATGFGLSWKDDRTITA